MTFSKYLFTLLNKDRLIVESSGAPSSPVIDVDSIKNQIESGVGGDITQKDAVTASFEALEKAFDSIPLDYLEKAENPGLEDIFTELAKSDKLDFLEKYAQNEKNAIEGVAKSMETIDKERDEVKFINYLRDYSNISERLLKIYRLCAGQIGLSLTEAVNLEPEVKSKVERIIKLSKEGAASTWKKILDAEAKNIDSLPETPEGAQKFYEYKDLLELLGLTQFLKDALAAKEKKVAAKEKPESVSTKRKKRIIDNRLIKGIQYAELPVISNDIAEVPGDLFKMFKALEKQNSAWMNSSLSKYVFAAGDSARAKEFDTTARQTESVKEEDQLTYLMACRSWSLSYIKGLVDGDLTEKEESNYVTKLENVSSEKEREIKNYYLSRDFNLGNFGGVQLTPEIRLPLYTRVKLPVTDEDRKKESPLRNILKGLGQIVTGLFGAIPDKGNEAVAKMARNRNLAIFNGLNAIVKGTVTAVGGKQAGRDYSEKVAKLVPGKAAVKEDMLSLGDAPGVVVVNPESPGQVMQTPDSLPGNNMDIFSLAGPGKKITSTKKSKKKSKKKEAKVNHIVSSFSDFMQRK
jgi:hypothetical protein